MYILYRFWDITNYVDCEDMTYNNNNNDRLTAFDPGQPG